MTDIVNVHQAKTHLSGLLDRAAAGEEVIIAKAGKPVARLTGLDESAGHGPRQPGMFPGLRVSDSFFEPLPDEELSAWEQRYEGQFGVVAEKVRSLNSNELIQEYRVTE
jgi:prevent-host-death family protein